MDGKVKALDVWFCVDCQESKKKKNIINNWRNQRFSLIGKIAVIKALTASQIVYIVFNNVKFKIVARNKLGSF